MLSRRHVLAGALACAALPTILGSKSPQRSFGICVNGLDSASISDAQQIAGALGKRLDVVGVYEAFAWQRPCPIELISNVAACSALAEITWEPWDPGGPVDQADYSLGELTAGRYDSYVQQWAAAAAAYGGPFLLRFGHEMNGNWYPWSVRSNGGSAEAYVAAFKHVRQIFVDNGAEQVRWVWSPNVILDGDVDAAIACYPGNDVVDLIGIDGYNFGAVGGHEWTSAKDLFKPTIDILKRLAPEKPLWVNEVGCSTQGGDRFQWFQELVRVLKELSVDGLILFQVDKYDRQWRITDTAEDASAGNTALALW